MVFRPRYLIIASFALCQLVSAQSTRPTGNQLGTSAPAASRTLRLPAAAGAFAGATVTLQADTITATLTPQRKLYVADGDVTIQARDLRLSADHMSYDSQTGEAVASGHVAFDSLSEHTHIEGLRGRYNFFASTGEFDDFHGVSGLSVAGRTVTPTSNNPLIFSGKTLLRLGPNHYRLEGGELTSCALPNPKWMLTARSADIELGGNARLRSTVFRLFDVPIFYAPFLTHSTQTQGRHSGVLLPIASHSTTKGYVLGDSFYWAAARNLNLTVGANYYSARGWGDQVAIEALPTRSSALNLELNGVFDHRHQGGQELQMNGYDELRSGFRAVLNVDYLSSYLYRLEFQNNFADATNSEAISTAFVEKQTHGRDLSVSVHRYQDFLGATVSAPTATAAAADGANLSLATLPSLDWTGYGQALDRRVPVYLTWDANAGLLDRSEPGFSTGIMERFDLNPGLTVPVATPAGIFTGEVSARSTFYSERQNAGTALLATAPPQLMAGNLWRNSATADLEWRPPALARVFQTPAWLRHALGPRIEHVVEPRLAYAYTGGVSNPNEIVRFDERDILTNSSEVDYGVTNRLLSAGATPGTSRDVASWTLEQKYFFNPTFSGALVPGARNVFLTTAMLSPFSVEALPLRFSALSSVVRVSPFSRFDGEWRLDYNTHDHQVQASAFSGNFHLGKAFFSGSHYLLHPPPGLTSVGAVEAFNQMRFSGGYGNAQTPGYSLAGAVAYDARTMLLQYTTIQASRNWDCCGFSVEYRHFSLASVRIENQFLVSFTLANVATFGNLKRQNRLF